MASNKPRLACCTRRRAELLMYLAVSCACSFAGINSSEAQAASVPQQCPGLESVRDREDDASAILQGCIDAAPDRGMIEIRPGNYTLGKSVRLARGIGLRSQGVAPEEPTCTRFNARQCATFHAAGTLGDLNDIANANSQFPAVMFHNVSSPHGVTFDHIVIDARGERRGSSEGARCARGNFSPTVFLVGENIKIRKSVIRNTLCGSQAIITSANGLEITDSVFENGGTHAGPWADGLTVLVASNALVARNQFRNNTDIDLIFGECTNCTIAFNRVTHSGEFATSSFGAIMLHAWPNTSGNYTGTTVTDNYVDCGGYGCGQAFIVGSLGWYRSQITRGFTFERNVAVNALAGFVIGFDVADVKIGDNFVGPNVGNQRCNGVQLYDYALAPGSGARFISNTQEIGPAYYAASSLAGVIPNTNMCSPSRGNALQPAPATGAEAVFRFILNDVYKELLGRLPRDAEVRNELPRFIAGRLTEVQLRNEIRQRLTAMAPFIGEQYRLQLKRCPDAWEVAIWRDALGSGELTKAEVIRAIAQSPEAESARGRPALTGACPVPAQKLSTLSVGEALPEGARLQAFGRFPSCVFDAVMQRDGNFVIYRVNRGSIWSTQTPRENSRYRLMLQSDGDVVLRRESGIPIWSSRTAGSNATKLVLQPDGNLVLYNQNLDPVWASRSAVPGCL